MAAAGQNAAAAQDVPTAQPETVSVYLLDVSVNGWPLGLVARFVDDHGQLRIPADQYEGLGFLPVANAITAVGGERWAWLDRVPGLHWTIDRANQRIEIRAPSTAIKPNQLRVAPGVAHIESRADWGAVFAWDAFGQWSVKPHDPLFQRNWSVDLDTRIFSPWFTAVSRGTTVGEKGGPPRFLRLETYVDFDNVGRSWRARVGDSYTEGPAWIRPIRFGGVQWSRDFALRPDIVTMPVPVLDQDIAAPSAVDLFVNGVQRYANAVNPGPLQLSDLPIVTGSNTIRAVITDRSGKRTEVTLPFYAASQLLVKGLTDFSFAAGFPRRNYNIESNDYGPLFGSAAVRYRISDAVTLTGYAAASKDYWAATGGGTATLAGFALVDGAVLYSRAPGRNGWALYGAASRTTPRFNIGGSYVRSFSYTDLADLAGYVSLKERATGTIGVNLNKAGQLNLVYARTRSGMQSATNVVSGTYGLDIGRRHQAHVSLSAFTDTAGGSWGAFLSLSLPLGARTQAYAQQGWRDGRPNGQIQLQGQRPGPDSRLDWQLNAGWERGVGHAIDAYATWEKPWATLFGRATTINGSTGIQGELNQSLALMDGRLFLSGPIDDSFTVVNVPDSPNVHVAFENRTIGRTDRSGHLLLTKLQSYVPNAISIDPLDLPIDASIAKTALLVSPRGGAGLVTRFDVKRARSAVVVLQLPDRSYPPPGATVQLYESDFAGPIGFDGEIYVRGLKTGRNRLNVSWREGHCTADFQAAISSGTLPRLGPFQCVP